MRRLGFLMGLALLIVCSRAGGERTITIIKGPYLQNAQQTSMTVMWETNAPADGKVYYGEGPDALERVALPENPGKRRIHRIVLKSLAPETHYFYQVESGGMRSGICGFKTAPTSASPITFIVYGDNRGAAKKHKKIADLMLPQQPDFVIHTGDMVMDGRRYEEWGTCFFDPLKEVISRAPIFPIMGNHEMLSDFYYDFFSFPAGGGTRKSAFYSFDYGPAHFAAVNVYEDYRPKSAQHKWLQDDLAKAAQAQWRFVFLHFAPFTSGKYRNGVETLETREYLQKVFEKGRVDIVFGGHDHHYERTFPLIGNNRDDAKGVTYIVSAGGGASLYDVDPQWFCAVAETRHNFSVVKIAGPTLTMETYDIENQLIDRFSISKDGARINELKMLVSSNSPQDRAQAASALGEFVDERAVEPLLKLLDDPDVTVRRAASNSLALIGQPKAVEGILTRLAQPEYSDLRQADAETQQNLAEALARSREPRALRGLMKLSDSPDELTRLMAMGGIRWVANTTAPDVLRQRLRNINPTIRRYLIAGLRTLGQVLQSETTEGDLKESNREERIEAIRYFQEHPDPSIAGPLLDVLRAEWQDYVIQREVLKALERLDAQKGPTIKALILSEAVKAGNPHTRAELVGLLDSMDHRKAVPLLMEAIYDEHVTVRTAAFGALERIAGMTFNRDRTKCHAWYEKWKKTPSAPTGPQEGAAQN